MTSKIISLITCILLFTSACTTSSVSKIIQGADHWVLLDIENAQKIDGKLLWDFELKRPVRYNVQIISKGELLSPFPELDMESGGFELREVNYLSFQKRSNL
jgi:hypothetical protein